MPCAESLRSDNLLARTTRGVGCGITAARTIAIRRGRVENQISVHQCLAIGAESDGRYSFGNCRIGAEIILVVDPITVQIEGDHDSPVNT